MSKIKYLRNDMKLNTFFLIIFSVFFLGCLVQKRTGDLDVMSSGGFTSAYKTLAPNFTNETNIMLNTVYGASLGGAPSSIPERLKRDESADVVILASQGLEKLIADGHVMKNSRVDLASSLIGMAIHSDDTIPDIGTVEAFLSVLRNSKSIAYSASASGTYLSTELFPTFKNADELLSKSIRISGERVGEVIARGEAEIGFQQVSELLPIGGITYVGTIPKEMQRTTTFSAGIASNTKKEKSAKMLIKYLSSSKAANVISKTGMRPLHR